MKYSLVATLLIVLGFATTVDAAEVASPSPRFAALGGVPAVPLPAPEMDDLRGTAVLIVFGNPTITATNVDVPDQMALALTATTAAGGGQRCCDITFNNEEGFFVRIRGGNGAF